MVTAGFRCAPLIGPATTTPTNTANAHAAVITIQPAFWDFDLASRTPATTASPSRTRSPVPKTSAMKMLVSQTMLLSLTGWGGLLPRGRMTRGAGPGRPARATRAAQFRTVVAGRVAPPLAPPFACSRGPDPDADPETGGRGCPHAGYAPDARQRRTREPSRLRESRSRPARNRAAPFGRPRGRDAGVRQGWSSGRSPLVGSFSSPAQCDSPAACRLPLSPLSPSGIASGSTGAGAPSPRSPTYSLLFQRSVVAAVDSVSASVRL